MSTSIAMVCNVYQDAAALRGLLETSSKFFDNLFIVHSSPGGVYSTDGTIELCEQFGATIVFDDISKGFGYIRSRCVHECGCEWAMILDADERFHPILPKLHCEGTEEWKFHEGLDSRPNLTVSNNGEVINQGEHLRKLISDPQWMAIRTSRRHWFDFTMSHPSQNWLLNRDYQLRIVRNAGEIIYRTDVVMHERIIDTRTGTEPHFACGDDYMGPFHDHYHLFFRKTLPGHKEYNEQNYQRLERGEKMLVRE